MVRTGAGAIKNYSQAMHARSTVGPRETSSSYSLVGVLKAAIKVGLIWACLLQRTQASHQSFCSVIASPCNGYTASQQDAINSAFNNHDCSVVPQLNDMKGHGCNQQTDQDALDDCIDAFIADCPSSPPHFTTDDFAAHCFTTDYFAALITTHHPATLITIHHFVAFIAITLISVCATC